MMDQNPCSLGALKAVFTSSLPADQVYPNPVLQVLQIKIIPGTGQQGQSSPERYRLVFSDSVNFMQAMLATQANHLIKAGELDKGCFVQLSSFQANKVKEKKILIVLSLTVLKEYGKQEKVGNPVSLEQEVNSNVGGAPVAPQQVTGTTFYGNKPSAPPQPVQRSAPQKRSGGGGGGEFNLCPIDALSPYQNKWKIKARVTHKSDIKTWHNQKGEGKLFSVTFLDDSGEIRATGFNDQCDALYEVLQEGQVFYISRCRVVLAKKQFSNVKNDYELTFEKDTECEKCNDQADDVPQLRFSFIQLADLGTVEKDALIDVVGVVKEIGEVSEIISKTTQKPYSKRDITLVDTTSFSVRLTVWGNAAQSWEAPVESVIAFKGVKVSDFGGRSLSMLHSSSMNVDPDIDEAHKLKGWFDAQGRGETFSSYQGMAGMGAAGGRNDAYKTLAQIKDENVGMGENPEYFSTKATIIYIKQENASYPACLNEGCNKKVVEIDQGQWKCEKCDITHPKPQQRYIMAINTNDPFGQAWLSCFDDVGKLIMGVTADELFDLKETDEKAYMDVFAEANCKAYVFRCRAKMDNYQDQQRVRYQVMDARPLNYGAEALKLAEQIKLYSLN